MSHPDLSTKLKHHLAQKWCEIFWHQRLSMSVSLILNSPFWSLQITCSPHILKSAQSQIGPIFVFYYCQHAKLNSLNTIQQNILHVDNSKKQNFFWANMTFILRPIWLEADLNWGRFDWKSCRHAINGWHLERYKLVAAIVPFFFHLSQTRPDDAYSLVIAIFVP